MKLKQKIKEEVLKTLKQKKGVTREEVIDLTIEKMAEAIIHEINKIENPYPTDFVKSPLTQEGKFWLLANRIWNNCKLRIKEVLWSDL